MRAITVVFMSAFLVVAVFVWTTAAQVDVHAESQDQDALAKEPREGGRVVAGELNLTLKQPIDENKVASEKVAAEAAQSVSAVLLLHCADARSQLQLDVKAAPALLMSSALLDVAADASLGLSPELCRETVEIDAELVGESLTFLRVNLLKNDKHAWKPYDVEKLRSALCKQLAAAFEESLNAPQIAHENSMADLQKQLEAAESELAQVRQDLAKTNNILAGIAQGYGTWQSVLQFRQNERNGVGMEMERLRSRLLALEPAASPLEREYQQIIEFREQRLNELKNSQTQGGVDASQIAEAELKLTEARAQLAGAKSAEPQRSRMGELEMMRRQLAELESRAQNMDKEIEKLQEPKLQKAALELPDLIEKEQRCVSHVAMSRSQLEQLRQVAPVKADVRVVVLDGKPDTN